VKKLKPKIAIIGGAGFVGKSLAKHLSKDFEVKILDVKQIPEDLKRFVASVSCDVRNYQEIASELNDVDLVIHTAIVQIPLINENKSLGYEVNIIGTQNACKAVKENPNVKGMILAGSWHTIGERELKGIIDEEFGFRPDKVEDRARLYALSKIAQESIVRFYDEMSDKIYGIIRLGTVLGEGMPEKTAANTFIARGFKGEAITPYKHSMYRPMLYVNIGDVCRAFEIYAKKILDHEIKKSGNSLARIVNVYYPEPITILELADITKESIIECTSGKVKPKIEIVDNHVPLLFTREDKNRIKVNANKAKELLGLDKLKSPRESVQEIVKQRIHKN
jgi:nucleoside-diphosphate-sugar epimerase